MVAIPTLFLFFIYAICLPHLIAEGEVKFDVRLPIAGGLAGGISNGLLHPIDTIKTMQQSDKNIKGFRGAVNKLRGDPKMFTKMYSGYWAAVFGSIPSSAIYFGCYESAKRYLNDKFSTKMSRQLIHVCAAASGNIMSSFVFVPKDVLKAIRTGIIPWTGSSTISAGSVTMVQVISHIIRTKGVKGFYPSYRATLMRNIPNAVLRFTVYEELRLMGKQANENNDKWMGFWYMVAGAAASGLASGFTTPLDVVKTRLATGVIPPGTPVLQALSAIARKEGLRGVYAGAMPRIMWSALFGGVGFATFEACKSILGLEVDQPERYKALPRLSAESSRKLRDYRLRLPLLSLSLFKRARARAGVSACEVSEDDTEKKNSGGGGGGGGVSSSVGGGSVVGVVAEKRDKVNDKEGKEGYICTKGPDGSMVCMKKQSN